MPAETVLENRQPDPAIVQRLMESFGTAASETNAAYVDRMAALAALATRTLRRREHLVEAFRRRQIEPRFMTPFPRD